MSGFLLWTPDAARARASPSLPSRSLRRRCASRSPSGDGRPSPPRCCVCPPAALAGCRPVSALPAPRRGMPVGSAPSASSRGSTRPRTRPSHAVTGARHRLIGVAYARAAALAGCRSRFAPPAPPGGMLVVSAPSASLRGSTRPGPLLSLAALALLDAVTSSRHRLARCCACPARCRAVWP